jgi:hypothetical protein
MIKFEDDAAIIRMSLFIAKEAKSFTHAMVGIYYGVVETTSNPAFLQP